MEQQIEKAVTLITKQLSEKRDFYGKIQLNFQSGILVNANIEESIKLNDRKHKQ